MLIIRPPKLYVPVYSDNVQDLSPRKSDQHKIHGNISGQFAEHAAHNKSFLIAEEAIKAALVSSFGHDEIFMSKKVMLQKAIYFAFTCHSEKTMKIPRQTTIYTVPTRDFVRVNSEQWVLDGCLKLSDCKAAYRINSAADIMAGGVQVFSVTDKLNKVKSNGLAEFIEKNKDAKDFVQIVGELVSRGLLQWENYNTGIKLDKVLAREMGFKLNGRNLNIDFKPLF